MSFTDGGGGSNPFGFGSDLGNVSGSGNILAGPASKTSGGGVTPEQMSLARYTTAENVMANDQTYKDTPMSTMKTGANVGAIEGGVESLAKTSEMNSKAQAANLQNQKSGLGSIIGGAGSLLGGLGGGGGGGG
jgi:hypothetical protein